MLQAALMAGASLGAAGTLIGHFFITEQMLCSKTVLTDRKVHHGTAAALLLTHCLPENTVSYTTWIFQDS